jgi:hypothetical protein
MAGYSGGEFYSQYQGVQPSAPDQLPGSPVGAFVRHAIGGALPAIGGLAAAGPSAEAGAAIGALGGPFDEFTIPAGFLIGGALGALGGGTGTDAAQHYILAHNPDMAKALGQDSDTQAADESEHPVASFLGGLAPQALLLRPSLSGLGLAKGMTAGERIAALGGAGVGAAIQGGSEAYNEYSNTGELDPGRIAMAAGAGALLNHETALGRAVAGPGRALVSNLLPDAVRSRIAETMGRGGKVDLLDPDATAPPPPPTQLALPAPDQQLALPAPRPALPQPAQFHGH